jgi:hypothetical protein
MSAAAAIGGLAPNHVYHFRIVASSSGGTVDGRDMTFQTTSGCVGKPPTVATLNPTGVSDRTADLRGSVIPNGCPTSVRFQYGLTTRYGHSTPWRSVGRGLTPLTATAFVGQLSASTVYHFRIIASSAGRRRAGRDATFKTAAPPVPSTVLITGRRAYVRHRFVVRLHLACAGGALPCAGIVRIFRHHHLIGLHGFFLAPHSSGVVSVRLNRRGRRLMRHHRRRVAEIVARTPNTFARRKVLLIRRLRLPS